MAQASYWEFVLFWVKGDLGMRKLIEKFRREEDGAAMIEYTVLLGIISVAVIASVIAVGGWVTGKWSALEDQLIPPA